MPFHRTRVCNSRSERQSVDSKCRTSVERKDDARMQSLRKILAEKPFFLYLNNADREVVESFTGPLPPYNSLHSFLSNLAQLGLTSQKAAVK